MVRLRLGLKYCQYHYGDRDSKRPILNQETETQFYGLRLETKTEPKHLLDMSGTK